MATQSVNLTEFLASLPKDPVAPLRGRLAAKIGNICRVVNDEITDLTPVWSGYTLRNYVWTMDDPYDGEPKDALGTGDKGPTNSMALGTEPRRPENQEPVEESFDRLKFDDPYHAFILTNRGTRIEGLEYGLLPYDPLIQRSPDGMFRLTFETVVERLEGGVL